MNLAQILLPALLVIPACRSASDGPARALNTIPDQVAEDAVPAIFRDAAGFDPLVDVEGPDGVQVGDGVLFRLTLNDGDEERVWWLRSRLERQQGTMTLRGSSSPEDGEARKFEKRTPGWRCAVEVLEVASGELILSSMIIPRLSMSTNLFTAQERLAPFLGPDGEALEEPPEEVWREVMLGFAAVVALFNGWQENEPLADVLKQVVGTPSLFGAVGALFSGGLNLNLSLDIENARSVPARLPAPIGELPGSWMPFTVSLGGDVLLFGELHSVAPAAPLSVGLGVVALRGTHPSDEERWVRAEIVGARRAK